MTDEDLLLPWKRRDEVKKFYEKYVLPEYFDSDVGFQTLSNVGPEPKSALARFTHGYMGRKHPFRLWKRRKNNINDNDHEQDEVISWTSSEKTPLFSMLPTDKLPPLVKDN